MEHTYFVDISWDEEAATWNMSATDFAGLEWPRSHQGATWPGRFVRWCRSCTS